MEKENNELKILGALTNLGKYNEGELCYTWIQFPCSPETLQMAMEEIGIGEEDEFGQPYEEYFFSDFDCYAPSQIFHELSEYESIEHLQVLGKIFEKINELGDDAIALFEGLLENYDYLDAAYNVIEDNAILMSDVENDYDLGYYMIDGCGGVGGLSNDTLETYFDYDSLGRDLRLEYYGGEDEPETIQEYLGLDEWATDTEIGEEYFSLVGGIEGISHPENYFDYEGYGRDCRYSGEYIFTSNGCIDYSQCDNGGQDLYEDIKNQLIDDGIISEPYEPSLDDEER